MLQSIVVLAGTTTIKLQGATNVGGATTDMRYQTNNYGSGSNATRITAVKIA
jgi:hypothetical protein